MTHGFDRAAHTRVASVMTGAYAAYLALVLPSPGAVLALTLVFALLAAVTVRRAGPSARGRWASALGVVLATLHARLVSDQPLALLHEGLAAAVFASTTLTLVGCGWLEDLGTRDARKSHADEGPGLLVGVGLHAVLALAFGALVGLVSERALDGGRIALVLALGAFAGLRPWSAVAAVLARAQPSLEAPPLGRARSVHGSDPWLAWSPFSAEVP